MMFWRTTFESNWLVVLRNTTILCAVLFGFISQSAVYGADNVFDFTDILRHRLANQPQAPLASSSGSAQATAWESGIVYEPCLLYELRTNDSGGAFGVSLASGYDIDGDGYDDILVGADGRSLGSSTGLPGKVFLYSGQTGGLIYSIANPTGDTAFASRRFGVSVDFVPDTDGDGIPDVLVGAYAGGQDSQGKAYLFSGSDGSLRFSVEGEMDENSFGISVAGITDLNDDGFGEIIVGAPFKQSGTTFGTGDAHVYSGSTGEELYVFQGEKGFAGWSVAALGDVDLDGYSDFLVGEIGGIIPDTSFRGSVHIVSGKTGAKIRTFGPTPGAQIFYVGWSVSPAGDVDGDGVVDVSFTQYNNGPYDLVVYSSVTGNLLLRKSIGFGLLYGARYNAGDLNGDGFDDVAAGSMAQITSGANNGLLYSTVDGGEFRSTALGDVNNDGFKDMIISNMSAVGVVRVYALGDADCDGLNDLVDECTDFDGDGFGDPGFSANVCAIDNCPAFASANQIDQDGDGLGDVCDNCATTPNPEQT
ncbi:MAG: FG-GAP repeat protein, partial [candidate division Zixibacteria bacterium]|nr:FG-GAP repeat protein [candidate division Zixibacteria bacterium]